MHNTSLLVVELLTSYDGVDVISCQFSCSVVCRYEVVSCCQLSTPEPYSLVQYLRERMTNGLVYGIIISHGYLLRVGTYSSL